MRVGKSAGVGVAIVCALVLSGCGLLVPLPQIKFPEQSDSTTPDDEPSGGSSQSTPGSTRTAHSSLIRVGHCVGPLKGEVIEDVEIISCSEPHYWEAFASTDLPKGEWPGQSQVEAEGQKFCAAEFTKFVGVAESESVYSWTYLSPGEESWDMGDQEILCFAGSKMGKITGSLKNVRR